MKIDKEKIFSCGVSSDDLLIMLRLAEASDLVAGHEQGTSGSPAF